MPRRITFILLIAFLVLTVAGWYTLNRMNKPVEAVEVAVSMPLGIEIGKQILEAVELALAERDPNAPIKIDILPVDVVDQGFENLDARNLETSQEIVANPLVVAVIGGTNSDIAGDSIPIFNVGNLAMISPIATWPGLTKSGYRPGEPGIYYPTGKRTFFRVIPSDDVQGAAAATWLGEQSIETVFITTLTDNRYSNGLAGILEANMSDYGMEIVGRNEFSNEDLTPELIDEIAQEIVSTEPDVLYFPLPAAQQNHRIIQRARELNPDLMVLGGDGLAAEVFEDDTDMSLLEGVFATSVVVQPEYLDTATEFVNAFREKYGKSPHPYAMTAYDAMNSIIRAIDADTPPTRQSVLDNLATIQDFTGAQGSWQFDRNGDATIETIAILQLINGTWDVIEVIR